MQDDLISRQEVLDVIASWFESVEQQRILQGRIRAISSAEPTDENLHREREQAYMQGYEDACKKYRQEPKTGYREYNDIYDHYLCGNCKTVVMDYDNFCPNCGCRMFEPQESEE